ncbi:MAG: hypothetical protein ACSW8G_00640 [Bacillota bacterium]
MTDQYRNTETEINNPGFSRTTLTLIAVGTILSMVLLLLALWLGVARLSSDSKDAMAAIAEEKNASAQEIDLANNLRETTVDYVLEEEEIPAYTYAEIQAMDMSVPSGVTVDDLKLVTRYKLVGTEETLYKLEQEYDLNCLFLLAIASHESAYGTAQFRPNNVCGYGGKGFSSVNECLETVGRALANSYLSTDGAYYKGKTIAAVNRTYAADGAWNAKVARKMAHFYQVISENHNAQLEKLR